MNHPTPPQQRTPHYSPSISSQASATPAPAKRNLVTPDGDLVAAGSKMIDQVFNSRSWERLRLYYEHANSTDEAIRRNGVSVLYGVAMRAANLLNHFKDHGHVRFTGGDLITADDLVYSFKTDQSRFLAQLNTITNALARVMAEAPGLRLLDSSATKEEAAAPLQIEIVGMPIRKTTTNILRDQAGDIATSVQVESDA